MANEYKIEYVDNIDVCEIAFDIFSRTQANCYLWYWWCVNGSRHCFDTAIEYSRDSIGFHKDCTVAQWQTEAEANSQQCASYHSRPSQYNECHYVTEANTGQKHIAQFTSRRHYNRCMIESAKKETKQKWTQEWKSMRTTSSCAFDGLAVRFGKRTEKKNAQIPSKTNKNGNALNDYENTTEYILNKDANSKSGGQYADTGKYQRHLKRNQKNKHTQSLHYYTFLVLHNSVIWWCSSLHCAQKHSILSISIWMVHH